MLRVAIKGLPPGVKSRVKVSGPGGFWTFVGASANLPHLTPGTYAVSARTFTTTDGTFRPNKTRLTVSVRSEKTATTRVIYRKVAKGRNPIRPVPVDPSAPALSYWYPLQSGYAAWSDYDPLTGTVTVHSRFTASPGADVPWLDPDPITFRTQEPSGVYHAQLASGAVAPVVVSTSPHVQRSKIAVILPDFTWQAYNEAGGWSMYVPTSDRPVSMNRPIANAREVNYSIGWNPIDLLERRYGQVDVIAQSQLHALAGDYDLSKYRLLIVYGHDEYWTKELRTEVESAVATGTNLLNMSGCTMWWKLDVNGDLIQRSTNWYATPGEFPEESLIGVSYRFAGYALSTALQGGFTRAAHEALLAQGFPQEIPFDQAFRYTDGFRVLDPGSPLLEGTGLGHGDWFGMDSQAVSLEVDGLPLTPAGEPNTVLMSGSPAPGTQLVAEAYAERGRAAVIVMKTFGEGHVISMGSIGWMRALLLGDPAVTRITDNAVTMLTVG